MEECRSTQERIRAIIAPMVKRAEETISYDENLIELDWDSLDRSDFMMYIDDLYGTDDADALDLLLYISKGEPITIARISELVDMLMIKAEYKKK